MIRCTGTCRLPCRRISCSRPTWTGKRRWFPRLTTPRMSWSNDWLQLKRKSILRLQTKPCLVRTCSRSSISLCWKTTKSKIWGTLWPNWMRRLIPCRMKSTSRPKSYSSKSSWTKSKHENLARCSTICCRWMEKKSSTCNASRKEIRSWSRFTSSSLTWRKNLTSRLSSYSYERRRCRNWQKISRRCRARTSLWTLSLQRFRQCKTSWGSHTRRSRTTRGVLSSRSAHWS